MSHNTHLFMQNTHEFAVRTAFLRRNKNAANSSVPAADLFPDGLRHVLLKRKPVLGVGISCGVSRGKAPTVFWEKSVSFSYRIRRGKLLLPLLRVRQTMSVYTPA